MLIKIFAWIWIVLGILFVIKPELLKKRLEKKGVKKIKKCLFAMTLALSVGLIVAAVYYQGVLAKILIVLGIIGIIKAFFFLKAKSAEKIIEWSAKQPLVLFRAGGCLYIIIGIIFLLLAK